MKLYDTATGKEGAFIPDPPGGRRGGAFFSPNGALLAQGGDTAEVWDARTGQKRCELDKLRTDVNGVWWVGWSADGTGLLTPGPDSSVLIWDALTGKKAGEYRGHAGRVSYAGSRPGSAEFYSYSQDGTARVWSLTPPPPPVTTHTGGADLKHAVLDRDATRFVSTTDKNLLRVRDAASGKLLQALGLDPKQSPNNLVPRRAGLSPDGTRLFHFRGPWGVTWDVPKGATVGGLTTPAGTACLDVAPDGERYAASLALGKGYSLAVVEAAAKDRWVVCGTGQGLAAAFSPDGTLLAAALVGAQNAGGVFDSRTGEGRSAFDATDVVALAFDGKRVAAGTRQGKVVVRDGATGKELASLNGHTQWVRSLAFRADCGRLVTASDDRTVRVWDPATGVCVITLRGPTAAVLAARFTPDRRRLVAVDQAEAVTVWDTTPVTQYTDPTVLERLAPPADEPDPEGGRP